MESGLRSAWVVGWAAAVVSRSAEALATVGVKGSAGAWPLAGVSAAVAESVLAEESTLAVKSAFAGRRTRVAAWAAVRESRSAEVWTWVEVWATAVSPKPPDRISTGSIQN